MRVQQDQTMTEDKNPNAQQNRDDMESQFDLQFILNLMWRLRYWMLLSAVVSLIIAAGYLYTKSNSYASQMVILITTDRNAGMSNSAEMSFIADMTGMASFNSLDNEKVIIRSTPVVQKAVEDLHLNVRYYVSQHLKTVETLSEEILLKFEPNPHYNVNNLPLLRFDYDIQDSTRMTLSLTDSSRKRRGNEGYIFQDSTVLLPCTIELPRYGRVYLSYRSLLADMLPTEIDDAADNDGFEYLTPGDHYILLYSPQARAQEICKALDVSVVEEGRRSTSMGGGGSSILAITLVDNIPSRAEHLLERIVAQYNLQTKEYYSMSYTNTMEFIQTRLVDLKDQLSGVEGKIKDFSVDNNVYDLNSQASFNLNSDMQRQQRAQDIDIQISLLNMVANELKEKQDYSTIPSNIGITDNTIIASITEYNRLCVERVRLLSGSSESSPVIQQLYLQLNARRELICKTIENQLSMLTSQKEELDKMVGNSKRQMKQLPGKRLNLAGIEREQSVIEPLYVLLQKKREETMLAIIAEPDIARIVEHAENNTALVGPNRRRIYLIALLLGLMIPMGIAYAFLLLKTKIATPEDITSRTHIPILGVVPMSSSKVTKAQEIIERSTHSTITEVFRSLRTSLTFMEGKVFQVTSSVPSEGKSFVSVNLALCFAAAGKKTVLVETDLRKGHQRRSFEVSNGFSEGLSSYLAKITDDWKSLIYHVPNAPNLDVIFKGQIPANPNELLSSNRLEQLIEQLKAEYDYIILDSPPYLLIADPITINRVADRNIYVMRAGISDLRFVNEIDMAARNEKLTKPVIVLNGLNMETQGYYGRGRYGYGYGYAYGYSYGYNEYHKEENFFQRLRHKWKN